MSYVAFQYAEALFSLANEENVIFEVTKSLDDFVAAQDTEVYKFLNHPKVTNRNKKEVIGNVIQNTLVKNFVYVLIDNSRIDILEDVQDEFKKIVDAQNKLMNVVVYSGKLMEISALNKLKNNIAMKHNRKVKIENIVDEKIIGGLRIEYEGNVLDETINNRLQALKNNLTK